MKVLYRILILTLITSILSCNKEDAAQKHMSQTEIWECYNNTQWSEVKIKKELIGKWKWVYTENYWNPDKGRNTENENTLLELLSDSTLNVIVNGKLEHTTQWIVSHRDGTLFGLELDSSITTLVLGRILICKDNVLFNNSYIDGSDNYFIKIK